MKTDRKTLGRELDWVSMIVPMTVVLDHMRALFMIFRTGRSWFWSVVRGFLGDDFGLYYALMGTGTLGCTLYIAFLQIRQNKAWRL